MGHPCAALMVECCTALTFGGRRGILTAFRDHRPVDFFLPLACNALWSSCVKLNLGAFNPFCTRDTRDLFHSWFVALPLSTVLSPIEAQVPTVVGDEMLATLRRFLGTPFDWTSLEATVARVSVRGNSCELIRDTRVAVHR